jgi:predicted enzyme related to lactoylglutathione lyase
MEILANIDVPDLGQGERFYVDAFGFTIGRRFEGAVELLGAPCKLYLLEKASGSATAGAVRDYGRHWTPVHLDIVVDDLDQALARALAAGARQEGEIREAAWGRLALLADPFGHGVCLLQFLGRGYDELPAGG